ncbi:MAG: BolA family transcriptional regulator [Alphaproteobacteria bacterium]|nr:MAG: BolA family transcriptional regulator [Alphaproteobacteria bacterium]
MRIKQVLSAALRDCALTITNDSAKHAKHKENPGGEETHLIIRVISTHFQGMSRIARHRYIHSLLAAEFHTGLHAITLILLAPEEKVLALKEPHN